MSRGHGTAVLAEAAQTQDKIHMTGPPSQLHVPCSTPSCNTNPLHKPPKQVFINVNKPDYKFDAACCGLEAQQVLSCVRGVISGKA